MINYSKDEIALIFLSSLGFVTTAKFENVVDVFPNPGDIFNAQPKELAKLKEVFKNNYELFIEGLSRFNEKEFFDKLQKRGIECLTIISQNYPKKLLNLKNPPYVLYYVGNVELLKERSVAVVGTRAPSSYGKIVTEKLCKELADNGICVVSGLATGVDKIAHEGALEVGGNTIAVLGGGFDHIFPASNINLGREVAKKGLILTEYYVDVKPTRYTFPVRNRIIAGISDYVLITEAKRGSGSLYTKEYADELGKETFAVPGNINSVNSEATNDLIKRGQAHMVCCADDIFNVIGITKKTKENKAKPLNLSIEEGIILNILKDGEKDYEFLLEKTGFIPQTLNFTLTSMEIRGIIRKLAGNTYILAI